jgi:hypothetical protein
MNGNFISVGEALKLLPPFNGNMQEVLALTGKVDTAFAVISPSQEAIFYKFVLTRINGEQRNMSISLQQQYSLTIEHGCLEERDLVGFVVLNNK